MTGIQPLVSYLRANPEALAEAPEALAARFGLEAALVRTVLQALPREGPKRPEAGAESPIALAWARLGAAARRAADWAKRYPDIVVLIGSALFWTSLRVLPRAIFGPADVRSEAEATSIQYLVVTLLFGYVFVLGAFHTLVPRAAVAARSTAWHMLGFLVSSIPTTPPSEVGTLLVGSAVVAFVFGAASFCGMWLGAFLSYRRQLKARRAMSRQQMLERLFELRQRLQSGGQPSPEPASGKVPVHTWLRRNVFWLAPLASIVSSLPAAAIAILDPSGNSLRGGAPESNPLVFSLIMFASALVSFATQVCGGYYAGSPQRGALVGALVGVCSASISYLPVFGTVSTVFIESFIPAQFVLGLVSPIVLSTIGGLAEVVQSYAAKQKRLRENDPAAVLAEIVEIEWALQTGTARTCVLVFDVAGSTAMKRDADPLAAEWTFREYQQLLARLAEAHGGQVYSTAGDGAVLGFPEPHQALDAAHAVYAALPEFNKSTNRLATPFRLRAGIHLGEVQGQLDEVQFTRVIDVAAHVEGSAPVGGIPLAQPVLDAVPGLDVEPIGPVDRYSVFILKTYSPISPV